MKYRLPFEAQGKGYNAWHAGLQIGVEQAIGIMKKFRTFILLGDCRQSPISQRIAKNVAALVNINLKTVQK